MYNLFDINVKIMNTHFQIEGVAPILNGLFTLIGGFRENYFLVISSFFARSQNMPCEMFLFYFHYSVDQLPAKVGQY